MYYSDFNVQSNFLFKIFSTFIYLCVGGTYSTCMEVRGQSLGIDSSPHYGFWVLNSSHQACQQPPLFTELSPTCSFLEDLRECRLLVDLAGDQRASQIIQILLVQRKCFQKYVINKVRQNVVISCLMMISQYNMYVVTYLAYHIANVKQDILIVT